ncbi:cobalamin biosynthesis protein [Streptomyces purpureus]|uniref:cobalamin biosynthesis protein n=1 Tax=Streptomyces purpureus TaxID=1951 RepID=UPI00314052BD
MSGLVVGVGAGRGVSVDEVCALVEETLRSAGLALTGVRALATVEARAAEPGIVGAAARLGLPLVAYPPGVLASVPVPHPSGLVRARTGTPSVAEAAALAWANGGELLVPKRKSPPPARVTCAVARVTGTAMEGRTTAASGRGGTAEVGSSTDPKQPLCTDSSVANVAHLRGC